ncbi:sensor histidine kinase [Actinoplanes sp. RD1]|uniref:sensor histidine kinase n=1 Tax=Actinoplanes sp. RD1 TaxID=3064538 RepID=UPI00274119D7|nr:histidine kinase [Actinoplanes sp. RD1]
MTSAERWRRGHQLLEAATMTIIGLAAAVELITVAQAWPAWNGMLALLLAVAGAGVLRLRPGLSTGLLAAAPLVATALGWNPIATWNIGVFAALVLTLRGAPALRIGAVIGGANLVATGLAAGTLAVNTDPGAAVSAVSAIAAAAAGSAIRTRRQYRRELELRAEDAVANRAAAVQRGVAEERIRIARDLHDSFGHQIAVVSMHLGAAEVHGEDPAVRADLRAARTAVQAVLAETQQILRVLRVGAEADPVGATPSHERIPDLIDTFRSGGLLIDAVLDGPAEPLPPEVSAATFRITQEALTNAQRYGAGRVVLTVRASAAAISVDVVNPIMTKRPSGLGGSGLAGMRERASSVGGRLNVRDDGHLFQISAELPVRRGALR